jgi:hypothetical protein
MVSIGDGEPGYKVGYYIEVPKHPDWRPLRYYDSAHEARQYRRSQPGLVGQNWPIKEVAVVCTVNEVGEPDADKPEISPLAKVLAKFMYDYFGRYGYVDTHGSRPYSEVTIDGDIYNLGTLAEGLAQLVKSAT